MTDRHGVTDGDESPATITAVALAAVAGLVAGWALAFGPLALPSRPWAAAAVAALLGAVAYVERSRRWLAGLVAGAGLAIVLALVAVVGGGWLVRHF